MLNYEQVMQRYGDRKMQFKNYYDYSFTFVSLDGRLKACLGGTAEDISRVYLDAEPYPLDLLMQECVLSLWDNGELIYESRCASQA